MRFICNKDSFIPVNHNQVRWLEWNNSDYLLMKEIRRNISDMEYTVEHWSKAKADGYKFCAYIENEKIRSLACAIQWSEKSASWEVGAVQTMNDTRNKGCAKKVVSFVTSYILQSGKFATINTQEDNIAMQKVAQSIGFFRQD